MGARITCRQEIKKEISDFMLEEIGKRMGSIRESKDAVTVEGTKDGLKVAYPIGEVSGFASDYVEYSYNFHWHLGVNGSFNDDEIDEIYEDDYTPEIRNRLWKRIVDNLDAYMDDFRDNKDRIYKLIDKAKLSAEQKAVLLEITYKM